MPPLTTGPEFVADEPCCQRIAPVCSSSATSVPGVCAGKYTAPSATTGRPSNPNTCDVCQRIAPVFALESATGALRWQRTWAHTGAGDTIYAAPAVDGGMVFVALGGPDGGAYALSATTGAILWQTSHVLGFDGRPVVADGAVYFPAQTPGTLVALDEQTGAMRWQQGSSATSSTPVVSGGMVYTAGADEIVRAYHTQDGTPSWTFQTGGSAGNALIATGAALTVDSGTLYVGSQGGDLYALNPASGKVIWSVATGGPIDNSPAVADGAVFVNTENGQILAYRASDGAPAWDFSGGSSALIPSGPVIASATGQ